VGDWDIVACREFTIFLKREPIETGNRQQVEIFDWQSSLAAPRHDEKKSSGRLASASTSH
jgi:hypothetical protein